MWEQQEVLTQLGTSEEAGRLRARMQSTALMSDMQAFKVKMTLSLSLSVLYICYAQSTDSDHTRVLLRKPWIRALRNNPRIVHANLGSADFAAQASDPHAII